MSQRTRWGYDRQAGAKHRPDQLVRDVTFPPRPSAAARVFVEPPLTMADFCIPIAIDPVPEKPITTEIKGEVRAPSQAPRRAVIAQHQAAKAPPAMKEDPAPAPDPPPRPHKIKIKSSDIPSAMEVLAASWGKSKR